MPRLVIDGHDVEAPAGATILDAARALGLDIPTLCFLKGYTPSTSCMVCVVKVKQNGQERFVPSCAAAAEDGMNIESETDEVHEARRTALELLLGDHLGDCVAPCQRTCPAHMNIPLMIRQIAAGELREALATVKRDIALPAALGRICPEVCEGRCRRGHVDAPLSICLLKRYVADVDLASGELWLPARKPDTGKSVGIIGAGPAGLSAAYYLLQEGHGCVILDDHDQPGGMLRYGVEEARLPREVLDAELGVVAKLGAEFRFNTRVGQDVPFDAVRRDFNAVLIAVGGLGKEEAERFGLRMTDHGIEAEVHTHQTHLPGVFAAGEAVHRGRRLAVRSVADGKAAALCIHQYLTGQVVSGSHLPFTTRIGRTSDEDLTRFMADVSRSGREAPPRQAGEGLSGEQVRAEVGRCMGCDCGKPDDCSLRKWSAAYRANPTRYASSQRPFERYLQHADIIHEPGKCISCGLCIQIAREAGELLGLTFIGRGFDVRVGVPFGRSIAEGLRKAAVACAKACPTGALTLRRAHPG